MLWIHLSVSVRFNESLWEEGSGGANSVPSFIMLCYIILCSSPTKVFLSQDHEPAVGRFHTCSLKQTSVSRTVYSPEL